MTTPNIAPALVGFDRVIPARYTNFRNGSPMSCENCGAALVEGHAFAASFNSTWRSYCAECCVDYPAFCARAWRACMARVAALSETGTEVLARRDDAMACLQALVASPTDTDLFVLGRKALRTLRAAVVEAEAGERKAVLALDPLYLGLVLATQVCAPKFQAVAESMVAQWERKGSLSDKQISYATTIVEDARKRDAGSTPVVDWSTDMHDAVEASGLADGYYAVDSITGTNDLTFARIGTDGTGQRFVRHVIGGHPDMPVSLDWVNKLLAAIATVGALDAMATYGKEIGRCGACHRHLTDQTSRDLGFGPHCASVLGV